jgi:hypothetical protein
VQPGPYGAPSPLVPAGPPPGSVPLPAGRIRPSAWWFGVAGIVAAAGVILGVVLIVQAVLGFQDRIEDFERGPVPGNLTVAISDTGGYSIYHEYDGADDDRYAFPPAVSVTGPAGDDVPLGDYDTSVTYSTSEHEGVGLYTFDADVPGTYEVRTSGGDPGSGIAVGRGVGRGLVGGVLGGLAAGFVGVVAAVVIAIVVGVQRGRSRRALVPPPPFSGWGAPPPPAWAAPVPGPGAWPLGDGAGPVPPAPGTWPAGAGGGPVPPARGGWSAGAPAGPVPPVPGGREAPAQPTGAPPADGPAAPGTQPPAPGRSGDATPD